MLSGLLQTVVQRPPAANAAPVVVERNEDAPAAPAPAKVDRRRPGSVRVKRVDLDGPAVPPEQPRAHSPEPQGSGNRLRGFQGDGGDVFRVASIVPEDGVEEGEVLVDRAYALKKAPRMDFVIRTAEEGPDPMAHGAISLVPGAAPGGALQFDGDLEMSLAAVYSRARGSSEFVYDRRSGTIRLNVTAPCGLAIWGTPAVGATRLVIGKDCAGLGGYFGPLVKNMRMLDLTGASPSLQVAPSTFTGINFERVFVPGLGASATPRKFCVNYIDAFDLFGSPWGVTVPSGGEARKCLGSKRKKGIRGIRFVGEVQWLHWQRREEMEQFPKLEVIDISLTDWTTVSIQSTLENASTICDIVIRFFGSLSQHDLITRTSSGRANDGTVGRDRESIAFINFRGGNEGSNAGRPASTSYSVSASAYTSVASLASAPSFSSGALYNGVFPPLVVVMSACDMRAEPKSPILTKPSEVNKTFDGFRSRWRILFMWRLALMSREVGMCGDGVIFIGAREKVQKNLAWLRLAD